MKNLVVDAATFRKWQRMNAAKNALERRAKELAAVMNFPSGKDLPWGTKESVLVVDGNNNPIGKISIYPMPEKTIGAFTCVRVS